MVFDEYDLATMRVAADWFDPRDHIEDIGDPENGPRIACDPGFDTTLDTFVSVIRAIGTPAYDALTEPMRGPFGWGVPDPPGGPGALVEAAYGFDMELDRRMGVVTG